MGFSFFKSFGSSGSLGIDIGTASIKIVELTREGGRFKLLNYGIFQLENQEEAIQTNQKVAKLPDEAIVWGIKEVLKQTKIKSRNAIASIPSYSTFSTVITLPYLSEKDLAKTIPFEAKKYIPLPLSEVVVDWSIINLASSLPNPASQLTKPGLPVGQDGKPMPMVEVFLAAVPKREAERYKKIGQEAGLTLTALELENIGLIRALAGNDQSPMAIVNIGGRSTSILVVDKGYERVGHTYEIGGFEITKSIARSKGVSLAKAEELKKTVGLGIDHAKVISEAMFSLIDMMVFETKKTIATYETAQKIKIQKVVLVGGLANMPKFADYFKVKLGMDVSLGNPFARLIYPKEIASLTSELGTIFSVAIGLAMRGA
ncbi:MAG: Type IV pilus assembly protein [Parcubacteria group bacterium Gr01-1014_44]|nr:MAG: Type IV pilus assembly protein [Parcubacteria group bacterium Gr01-1014_44]